ncbi:flagellar basal body rod protein FlgC [Candidatus Puniceispirillum marinum]|uniref:Flagellar basal-body rod protein FlgC n=1 Tax=Puniceispirillum marinum (strain IMCC1322) TaxID=488538 RepID=D5BS47_PUNMI|nr:flagellar basal body rod protein FlgC [Candidatus Puniceispirillum marinum]ADE39094.1 flagellar basal-body rod protein FlgC [Candidatus Puniceispirillum marinum IMCC1322]
MADIKNVFDISGRAMAAQMVRLNTIASNLANAGNLASSEDEAYRSMKPVFETRFADNVNDSGMSTTQVVGVTKLSRKPERIYMPDHPKSDAKGFVYSAAVNVEEEFVEMLEASRQYQNNIEVVTTLRALMMRTINMGK